MRFDELSAPLNRVAHRRNDPDYLAQQTRSNQVDVLLVREGKVLVDSDSNLQLLSVEEVREDWELTLIGELASRTIISARPRKQDARDLVANSSYNWSGLRSLFGQMDAGLLELAAFASAMNLWSERHQFCGHCGSPAALAESGFRRDCSNADCAKQHFPRIDPAVIMLVESEGEVLLGRQASWPKHRYSALAGFVEPGESLEQAVSREVAEESGIALENVQYIRSQPWPFPSSLMIGFIAQAATREIRLDDELEDARWFGVPAMRAAIDAGTLVLPTKQSVAYSLLRHWLLERHSENLDNWEVKHDWR